MADKQNKLTYVVELDTKSGKVKIDGLTKGFVQAQSAVKNLNSELGKTTKNGLNPMIDKTGLAGATVVELGRTISDSNYGIRGMANNLSQLSTLMITLISTTGGVTNGFKALGKALKGPLGIIVLFQVAIAALERFDMQSKKTTNVLESMGTGAAKAGSNLKILRATMDDSSLSQGELARAVKKANGEYKDLNLEIGENGLVTEESRRQIDDKILSLEKLARASALQAEIEKTYADIVKSEIEEEAALRSALAEGAVASAATSSSAYTGFAKVIKGTTKLIKSVIPSQEVLDLTSESITKERLKNIKKSAKGEREELNNRLKFLTDLAVKENLVDENFRVKKTAGASKRTREFTAGQLDFDKEIIKSSANVRDSLIKDINLQIDYEFEEKMRLAKLKQQDFESNQQRRVDDIKDATLKAEAQKKIDIEIANSQESLFKYLDQLREERDRKKNEETLKDIERNSKALEKELGIREESELEFSSFLSRSNEQRFDRDIQLEKAKTENLIQELNSRKTELERQGKETSAIDQKIDNLRESLYQKQIERVVGLIEAESQRVQGIIKASQGAFGELSTVFVSYSDARIEALERERDYVLNSESLTKQMQETRIRDIEKKELQAQKNKIRLERELFTIKQTMLIAEQIAEVQKIININKIKIQSELQGISIESASQLGKAKMSVGTFVANGGLKGLAAYAITIGGLIASIFAARKQASNAIANLGGVSASSGGGDSGAGTSFIAPDFNIVGTTETSQLAQSIATSEQEPVKAYVVTDDISNAQELDRKAISSASLG
jgi:hypothetical protein